LHTQLGAGGIATERFVAEDFEEVYEYNLWLSVSRERRSAVRVTQAAGGREGTYAVGEVCDQVVDLDFPRFEFAVKPAVQRLAAWYSKLSRRRTIW
jgi:hypothetical protein